MKYLKTTTANDIYNIKIAECGEVVNSDDWSRCICFLDTDESEYNKLIYGIKEIMKKEWEGKWENEVFAPGIYWYVTTGSPSCLRNLYVVSKYIKREEDCNTQLYNYFRTEGDAWDCIRYIKESFGKV